jgi:hypothetical protein
MSARPLSRSLDPLPEESVTGYLLRLSFRLRVSPLHLARITGCVAPGQQVIGRRAMFGTDTRRFARAARLTEAEAESLTALPWAGRYPPVGRSMAEPGDRFVVDGWLSSAIVRHCPQCLAGDGSPVQQQYGGPWKKTWHLPVAFACTRHQRFLAEGCPRQHQRPAAAALIPSPSVSGLHPLQCRMSPQDRRPGPGGRCCGTRLDQAAGDGLPRPDPATLDVQKRIFALLSPQHPAPEAARAFTDLRLLSVLVCLTWPLSEDLMSPALAAEASEHVRSPVTGRRRLYDRQPRSILATAGILTAAAAIRDTADLESALARYINLRTWPSHHKQVWAQILLRHRDTCSPALRKPILAITLREITSVAPRGRRSVWPKKLTTASEACH